MWRSWMGWKMPLWKWQTFWMAPWLICYFIVLLFSVEKTRLLIRNLATVSPLKYRLSGKFQRFNAKDGRSKCWKIVEFPKISIKMKNCKTFYGVQTMNHLKEIIQLPPAPPPSGKILLLFGTKVFLPRYTEQTFAFKMVQECIFWASEACLLENWQIHKGFWLWCGGILF